MVHDHAFFVCENKKMAVLKEILDVIDRVAPFHLAEQWDNSGLQAGFPSGQVRKIMIGLDITMPLMVAAKNQNVDMVLSHHPLMMSGEKVFDFEQMPGSAICLAAKEQISIVSAHTNLDKADQGLNDYFAECIGIDQTRVFAADPGGDHDAPVTGIGRIGELETPLTLEGLAEFIKSQLGLSYIRMTGEPEKKVASVAICTGSGGSLLDQFFTSGADVYVTGDVKYHEARLVEAAGKTMIDVGHFGSEHIAIELLQRLLSPAFTDAGLDIEIIKYLNEKDPFTLV